MNTSKGGDGIGGLRRVGCRGIGSSGRTLIPISFLDQLQTTIVVVVIKDNEQRLQLASETIPDDLIDPDQVLVTKSRRKRGCCLDEVVGALTPIGRARGHSHEHWSGVVPLDIEG